MSTTRVKPADGLKVRTEDGRRHFKADGETVELTTYVRRRLAAGDLVEAPAARASQSKAKAAAVSTPKTAEE